MVWPLVLLVSSLLFPAPVFADEVTSDVPTSEQPALDGEQPSPPVSESVQVVNSEPLPLFDDDGLLVSTPDAPLSAPSRAALPSSLYGSVQPNNSYAVFADAFLPKLGWSDDYVFFRSGKNEYYLVFGALSFESGRFTGSDVRYVRWFYDSSTSGYLQQSGSGSLSLRVDNFIVLSSLGDFPTLSNDSNFTHVFVWCCVVAVSILAMSRMLSWSLRTRVEVIDNEPSR